MKTVYEIENIYNEFYPKLVRFFTRNPGEEYAEDLTQDVFIRVFLNISSFREESSLSTWIFTIARNLAIDFLRKNNKAEKKLSPLSDEDTGILPYLEDENPWTGKKPYSVQDRIEKQEMKDCYLALVEELPEQYRDAYILKEIEGHSNQEIAGILNISIENAKIRVHRGKAKMNKSIACNCDPYYNEHDELMAVCNA